MKIGSLCTGYGGLDMAARNVFGGQLAWVSDIEPGPITLLEHHHPGVPNLGDLKVIDWSAVEPVDILTAGYPCQPFSNAGLRKGTDDPRHIWPYIAYGIDRLRPRIVVLENVGAHLKRGFRVVAADLAALGYRVAWTLLRASDVGAAHRRERLFIVAADTSREHDDWPGNVRPGRWAEHPDGGGPAGGLSLLPTPTARDWKGRNQRDDETCLPGAVFPLLPTPTVGNVTGGNLTRSGARSDEPLLPGVVAQATQGEAVDWQEYEPAIRRWESVLGRPAPYPATRGPRGGVKVAPAFGEWLMGLPAGWISEVPGLSINEQLKLVGNGVVPQQAEHAIRWLVDQIATAQAAAA
ncbi:DNA cytosine methyltransferase [Actinophytocola sp. NPDC049390]|uniref:DNA cytosine methyltransferase n=1 Tax=Actinophytocola sp. NPDC049390 TaxID=3363894 RepID=UPI0037B4DE13